MKKVSVLFLNLSEEFPREKRSIFPSLRSFFKKTFSKKKKELSPALKNTLSASIILEKILNETSIDPIFTVFVLTHNSSSFFLETIKKVEDFNPDEIIFLPLFPESNDKEFDFDALRKRGLAVGLKAKAWFLKDYPREFCLSWTPTSPESIHALAQIIRDERTQKSDYS
jgi:hypothetical protein